MLDKKEEREYEKLRALGQKLHIPTFEAFLELEVTKDGKLIQRHKQRSHSWTRNAYNHLFSELACVDCNDNTYTAGKLSGKDTGGTVRFGPNGFTMGYFTVEGTGATDNGYRTLAGTQLKGIVVGSGVNAENFEDFALQTLIVEGAGAGQLNHVQSEAHSKSYAALTFKNDMIRYFNNNSGGDVDVNEVGLYGQAWVVAAKYKFMFSRDHLGATVTVPNTGQLKVTYTIQLPYPA